MTIQQTYSNLLKYDVEFNLFPEDKKCSRDNFVKKKNLQTQFADSELL